MENKTEKPTRRKNNHADSLRLISLSLLHLVPIYQELSKKHKNFCIGEFQVIVNDMIVLYDRWDIMHYLSLKHIINSLIRSLESIIGKMEILNNREYIQMYDILKNHNDSLKSMLQSIKSHNQQYNPYHDTHTTSKN